MSRPTGAAVLAWALWALWAGIALGALWFAWGDPGSDDTSILPALVGYATVGALVASRQPRNAVGWLLLVIALAISVNLAGDAYVHSESRRGYVVVACFSGLMFNVWLAIVAGFLPLVFPDGRLLSRRWRPVRWFVLVTTVLGILAIAFRPGPLPVNASIENPLGVRGPAEDVLDRVYDAGTVTMLLTVLLAGASLVVRFRRSTGREREQLKWFSYAVLVTLGGLLAAAVGGALPARLGEPLGTVGWTIFLATCILGIPVATGIAILRHRLYDIDVVINRTLVYGTLTGALVITYVGSVLLLRFLLQPFTGESDLWVAGSTLAVAALFRPARARIQRLVDRRFYRQRYDATRSLDEFAGRLRHELDLDAVGEDLRAAVAATVQPRHVSLWLRDAQR